MLICLFILCIWRHDAVLSELADRLENERKKERGSNPKHHITFVAADETMTRATPQQASILDGTTEHGS